MDALADLGVIVILQVRLQLVGPLFFGVPFAAFDAFGRTKAARAGLARSDGVNLGSRPIALILLDRRNSHCEASRACTRYCRLARAHAAGSCLTSRESGISASLTTTLMVSSAQGLNTSVKAPRTAATPVNTPKASEIRILQSRCSSAAQLSISFICSQLRHHVEERFWRHNRNRRACAPNCQRARYRS